MKFIWNRELKKLCVQLIAVSLLILLFCNLILAGYRANSNREYHQILASLVGSVMEAYPDTSEDELILMLNGQGNAEIGEQILRQYGIFLENENDAVPVQKRRTTVMQWEMNLMFTALAAGMMGILFFYLSRRQKQIQRISGYMEELVRGNYALDIQDNGDDELSGLKNEIYKLTVFFREQAKHAAANRLALADSVADISHQLKTPLTSVTVLVDNLLDNEDMEVDTRRRFLMEISGQLSSVTWLVSTLLKLSRLDAGVVELENRPLQVCSLAQEVLNRLELMAELGQVELCTEIPETIQISGDTQWLTEALLNVVKNAVEHSSAGGRVILRAEENDVYTLLTVQNRGEPISEEEQMHLFERFYRGHSAKKESIGIGLALAKEIVEKQNGYITVESGKEKGTIFYIKFMKCH